MVLVTRERTKLMPISPVNVIWDITLGFNFHDSLPVVPGTPVKAPAVEMVATQMWTAGYFVGQNKFTTTVMHGRFPIVLDGHNIGMLIPDVSIPPVNLLYPVMWPFSSRKIMLAAPTVNADGKGIGCACIPLIPMPTCGDPADLPTSFPLTSWLQTVRVDVPWGALLLAWAQVIVSCAIDFLFDKLGKGSSEVTNIWSHYGKKVVGKFIPSDLNALNKKMLHSISDALFSLASDSPKVEVKFGISGVLELGVSSQPGDAAISASAFGGSNNRGGFGAGVSGHVTHDNQGNHSTHRKSHLGGQNYDSRQSGDGGSSGD
jgi:hypothetical protein